MTVSLYINSQWRRACNFKKYLPSNDKSYQFHVLQCSQHVRHYHQVYYHKHISSRGCTVHSPFDEVLDLIVNAGHPLLCFGTPHLLTSISLNIY